MKKIKIGVLSKDIDRLQWWELRLLDALMQAPWAEISVLIRDRSAPETRGAIVRRLGWLRSLAYVVLKLIVRLEHRLLRPPGYAQAEAARARLRDVPTMDVVPLRKGVVDRFVDADVERIRALDLDVLLRHSFGILKGDILRASRHGIWSLHHADNRINRGGPPGFWEIVLGQPVTGVTLQRLSEELDGGEVIGKAFYSTHRLYSKNASFIHDKSALLVLKWLRVLAAEGSVEYTPSGSYSQPLLRLPGLLRVGQYTVLALAEGCRRGFNRAIGLLGLRAHVWGLRLGRGDLDRAVLWRTRPIKAPAGHFWADPFVLKRQGRHYLFFEDYDYAVGRACISWGEIDNGEFRFGGVALSSDKHLSYPFIFEHEGEVYMLPETYEARRLEVWRAVDFPGRWVLHATALEGESVVDPTIHVDDDGQIWLFVNLCRDAYGDHNSELYVYRIGGMDLKDMVPHQRNPVVMDCRGARSAGRLFRSGGRLLRPGQINQGGVYGAGLALTEIRELTLSRYVEQGVDELWPKFEPGLVGLHHAERFEGGFVVDACRRYEWR